MPTPEEIREYFESPQAKTDFERAKELLKTKDTAGLVQFMQDMKGRTNKVNSALLRRATYDSKAKALYIYFGDHPKPGDVARTEQDPEHDMNWDIGANQQAIGIEILNVELETT